MTQRPPSVSRLFCSFALLGVCLLLAASLSAWPATNPFLAQSGSPRFNRFDTLRSVSEGIITRTNQERRQRGLTALIHEERLRRIACAHSRDMLRRDFMRHKNPDGELPGDRVARHHRRLIGGAGENLWSRTGRMAIHPEALADTIVTQWMESPPHRKNILRRSFSHLGVCTVRKGDRILGTQVFAQVRAYLETSLPRTAPAGGNLVAPIGQTFPPNATIAKYNFWDPRHEVSVTPPRLFADTLQLPDTTGAVRLQFYVPETNRYRIYRGPEIRLTSPNR
jgi:uncharacterized protein YkwD